MKLLEVFMFLYQYLYYVMREWDKQLGMPDWFTKSKFNFAILVFESWPLIAIYGLVSNIIFQRKMIIPDCFLTPSGLIGLSLYTLVLWYINQRIIGGNKRIHHYKKIFDTWSKKKRGLWKLYIFSILALLFAIVYIVGVEIDQYGLSPKNWKWE